MRRAVFNIVEDVEEHDLALCSPLVFVDVRHHFFDGGQRLLQFGVVRVALGRLLEQVGEEEADGWKPLNGADEQLLEALPFAPGIALAQFEECVEARLGPVARAQHLFGLLEKVDKRRVRLDQILRLQIKQRRLIK